MPIRPKWGGAVERRVAGALTPSPYHQRGVRARKAGGTEGREKVTMMGDEEFMRDLYDLLHLFGDKLVSPIVVTLAEGPIRRVEILSMIRSYSVGQRWSGRSVVLHDSILARALKKMTARRDC
jgi:hypothetical protein